MSTFINFFTPSYTTLNDSSPKTQNTKPTEDKVARVAENVKATPEERLPLLVKAPKKYSTFG